MSKSTLGNNLPRRAERNLQIVGEQIRLARLRRDLVYTCVSCSRLGWMRVSCSLPKMTRWDARCRIWI